jgi:hypothetical protein
MRFAYDNSGRFWHGIPMRDMDKAEIEDADKDTFGAAVKAGAYTQIKEQSDVKSDRSGTE